MKKQATKRVKRRRSELVVSTFATIAAEDRAYWHRQTPAARLRAMELMRQINFGKAATGKLQRVLEVVDSNFN